MCGICGFSGLENDALLRAMAAALEHRGPDEDGFFSDGEAVSLGMRRLRIIDLSTGAQPIFNEDRTVSVVFNGEIYNFMELRRELEAQGHRFRTNTDTEVLVHLYEQHGEDFPARLRGMFAFALWDSRKRRLLLARDQFGIKPLYYAAAGGRLYFASELKALRLVPGLCGDLDAAALDNYFTYLYIPAPLTVYKGVRKLPPASMLVFAGGEPRIRRYWELKPQDLSGRPEEFYLENIRDLLSKSVKEQLVSDVPLGLLLSGGVDSACLLSFMAEHAGRGVKTFTAGFSGADAGFDETAAARRTAEYFGAEHLEVPVNPDIGAVIRKLAGHFDEPFADSSALASYLVTREARRAVTVALAGIGGDELFAGYPRHLAARFLPAYLRVPAPLRRLAGGAFGLLPESRTPFNVPGRLKRFFSTSGRDFAAAYSAWIGFLGQEEKKTFYSAGMLAAAGAGAPRLPGRPGGPDDILAFELENYLPADLLCLADRTSMANSLEMRVPFTDTRLVEFMAGVPLAAKTRNLTLKYLLKKAMSGRLPAATLAGSKRGFQVPLARWQDRDLKAFTAEALSPAAVKSAGVLSPEGVAAMLAEHSSGRRNLYDRIYAASVFQLWHEHHRRNPPAAIGGAWSVRGRRKILLVNMAGLGDIIMMTPAVRAIKAAYPDSRLELLTIDRSKELAAGITGIDKIHSVPIRYRLGGPGALLKFASTLLGLRREGFDALVNFSLVSSRGGLLKARLINGAVNAGLSSCRVQRGLGAAGTHTVFEEFIEKQNAVDLIARLLPPLGIEQRDMVINYEPSAEDRRAVEADLAARGLSGRPLIGLNPGAFRPSRRWPLPKWRELAGLLLEKYPSALLVVTGSAEERGLAEALKVSDRVFASAGLYTLGQNAALYGLMDVFITNDTGPMHLAAAVGTKTVCIFGPGDHWRFAPSVPEARKRVLRKDLPGCEMPCYKFECPNPACLEAVMPAEVLAAAGELLG